MKKLFLLTFALALGAVGYADSTTNVIVGRRMIMSVSVTGGTMPFSYQWSKNGQELSGATQSSNGIQAVTPADAGVYTCVVKNSSGQVVSDRATVFIVTASVAPAITAQPVSQTVTAGSPVTFTVAASGVPAPAYQWRKNGVNINGATSATYTIAATSTSDVGSYTVVATNSAGSVTSNQAALTINMPPVILPPGSAIIQITVIPAP